jgi:ABC-type multidrug transport system fused ATPase/permease subunit
MRSTTAFKDQRATSDTWWLLRHLYPYLYWHLLGIACLVVNAGLILVEPLIIKRIIDTLIPARNLLPLIFTGALLFFVSASRLSLGATSTRIIYHVNQKFVLRLRMKLFRHANTLSANYHEATPVGTNTFVIQDSVNELGELSADIIGIYLRTAILFIGTLGTMFYLNTRLAVAVLPLVGIFVLTVSRTTRGLQSASETVQEEASLSSSFLQEHLSSVIQIQLLARERLQACKAFRAWSQLARAGYARNRAECLSGLSSSIIMVGGEAAILGYGSVQVIQGILTVGGLIAFYRCLDRLFDPLYFSIDLNTRFLRAAASVHRIREFLETPPSIMDHEDAEGLPTARAGYSLAIQDTSFGYRSNCAVINDLSLAISAGERIALIGPSGCGKSTLAKLIVRQYDVDRGAICIDGIDIRKATLESIRSCVSHVPQHTALFNATLEENLKYGNPRATRAELHAAAEHSGLLPVIERLPRGWAESLGPSGGLLSGGERQRVALARALLRHPRILILDESTAELDSVVESSVFASMDKYLKGSTLIIITHRLPAITWVDRIAVFNGGKIVDIGTHQMLYARNALYIALFNQQKSDADIHNHIAAWTDIRRSSG